jgi:hypothetical protein
MSKRRLRKASGVIAPRTGRAPRTPGIFCLEGDWWNDFNQKSTVKPILKLLSQGGNASVPYVHRDVGTVEEFRYYCRRWAQRGVGRQYPILYLAFHGSPSSLCVGDQRKSDATVSLDELAAILGNQLHGRLVHFGACGTLRTDHRNIQRFLRSTGAIAASGFRQDVDWLYSAVFEVLLFEVFVRRHLSRTGAKAIQRELFDDHASMCRRLDFRFVIRE